MVVVAGFTAVADLPAVVSTVVAVMEVDAHLPAALGRPAEVTAAVAAPTPAAEVPHRAIAAVTVRMDAALMAPRVVQTVMEAGPAQLPLPVHILDVPQSPTANGMASATPEQRARHEDRARTLRAASVAQRLRAETLRPQEPGTDSAMARRHAGAPPPARAREA